MRPEPRVKYITVAPVTQKGKWLVASRTIGSKERYRPIAECRCELIAEQIVASLNYAGANVVALQAAE